MTRRKPPRCEAAHRNDRRPCEGMADAVIVRDPVGESRTGCILHAAALTAALGRSGRIELHNGAANAAVKAYQQVRHERGDCFLTIQAAMQRHLTPVTATGLLTPGEVAAEFRVDIKTVARWASAGLLPARRTLGGHRRFRRADVEQLLASEETTP